MLNKKLLTLCACLVLTCHAHASESLKPAATVNGVKIAGEVLELLVANNVAQGGKDTPELRAALKNELIAREVLAQEAKKQKLDQEPAVKAQLTLQQGSLLADALIAKQAPKETAQTNCPRNTAQILSRTKDENRNTDSNETKDPRCAGTNAERGTSVLRIGEFQ